MTVYKTFLKILKKNLATVILYTSILVIFAGFNMQTNESSMGFVSSKPDILIVNNDKDGAITKDLVKYLKKNSTSNKIKDTEEARLDALFYNDTDYIIYIPKGFSEDFMNGNLKEIEVKSGGNFNSAYAEMLLNRYLNLASTYKKITNDEKAIISMINNTLKTDTEVNVTTKLDTDSLERAAFFYNFSSYSILACLIFIICLILSIFNNEKIRKRNIISSTNYKKINRELLFANLGFSLIIWLIYILLSIILVGSVMFTANGLLIILNSLIFLVLATTLAFFLGTLINNKDAINGIMNVVALGSSFLCGVFVPMEYLPDFVVSIAKIIPTYYFVKSNEIIKTLEEINFTTLTPVFINMVVLVGFSIVFIILTNVVTNKRRKIG